MMRQLKFVKIIKQQEQYFTFATVQMRSLDFSFYEHGQNKKRDIYQQMSYDYQQVLNIVVQVKECRAQLEFMFDILCTSGG